jgi:hypothetical protein
VVTYRQDIKGVPRSVYGYERDYQENQIRPPQVRDCASPPPDGRREITDEFWSTIKTIKFDLPKFMIVRRHHPHHAAEKEEGE